MLSCIDGAWHISAYGIASVLLAAAMAGYSFWTDIRRYRRFRR